MKSYGSILLVICSIFLSIFICELILLILNFPVGIVKEKIIPFWLNQPGAGLQGQQTLLTVDDPKNVISAYEYSVDHGIRLKGNIDKLIKAFAIPDKEIEKRLPPWRIVTNDSHYRIWGDKRIVKNKDLLLIMGGSSPFGWGVDFKDSFPAIIAQAEDSPFKIMNLAVPTYTIHDTLLLYKEYRETIRSNDSFCLIIDGGSNNMGLSSMSDSDAYEYRRSWKGKVRAFISRFRLYWLIKGYLNQHGYLLEELNKVRVPYKEYKRYLKEIIDMAIKDRGKIVLINICNDDETLIRIMRDYASRSNIPFFDVNLYFNEVITSDLVAQFPELTVYYQRLYGRQRLKEYPRWLLEFHKNCHPNILGHKLIAQRLRLLLR